MSQQRRGGLGRGLGALIPTKPIAPDPETVAAVVPALMQTVVEPAPKPVMGAYFDEIPLADIVPNPRQPRKNFGDQQLKELTESIAEVGLLQPIVVRALGGGRYELVMGERRCRASKLAGLARIPAIVRSTHDDDMLRDALLENLQREQLNPLEEAAAYQQLLDDFGATHEQLAQRVSRSRSHVTNMIRLLKLPPDVQKRVAAGVLSAGHARALCSLDDPHLQEHLARRIVAEQLSVRAVEEIVAIGDVHASSAPTRERAAKKAPPPALRELADHLSDRFETKVKVDMGRQKGRIVVEFASLEDLERILVTLAPEAVDSMHDDDDR
ncbi:chromosome partitioning protein, ParB family [Sinosporangium album]|uniref:Chromosome partitioning protein, ParB family n=1 Tax=Sinosporangium album TaxID=504805 RepID=A0A1G8ETR9_9ACTN|nr:ParB/RepB/Spo0J family partition protein [Sinosporangium album]SDH73288.1 chromosome partitioning protein, ParB family [Sinosporangium album]